MIVTLWVSPFPTRYLFGCTVYRAGDVTLHLNATGAPARLWRLNSAVNVGSPVGVAPRRNWMAPSMSVARSGPRREVEPDATEAARMAEDLPDGVGGAPGLAIAGLAVAGCAVAFRRREFRTTGSGHSLLRLGGVIVRFRSAGWGAGQALLHSLFSDMGAFLEKPEIVRETHEDASETMNAALCSIQGWRREQEVSLAAAASDLRPRAHTRAVRGPDLPGLPRAGVAASRPRGCGAGGAGAGRPGRVWRIPAGRTKGAG